jgi:hypothetical protein
MTTEDANVKRAADESSAERLVLILPSPYMPLMPNPEGWFWRLLLKITEWWKGPRLARFESILGLQSMRLCPGDPLLDDARIPYGGWVTVPRVGDFNYLHCDRWTFWPRGAKNAPHQRGNAGCVASPTAFTIIDGLLRANKQWVAFGPQFRSASLGNPMERYEGFRFVLVSESIAAHAFLSATSELPPELSHVSEVTKREHRQP